MEVSHAVHATPDRQPTVWERVPQRNQHFSGRESLLLSVRDNLTAVSAVVLEPHAQALQGQGGVGKTQLAVEYAWRYRRHYDLVYWIPAEKRELLPASIAALAPYVGLPSSSGFGIEETARAVKRALETGDPYRRWLIIFDNADEPHFLSEFVPAGPGHTLITSRNPKWATRVQSLRIDVFTREESVAFLRTRVRRDMPEDSISALADRLGDLPLALEQAGALMHETAMDIDEYVELLDEQQTHGLMKMGKSEDYPQSMAAAWQLSVHQLRRRLPQALLLLRCCAFFGPEPIPRDIFRRGAKAETPLIAPILADPLLLTKALSVLSRYALAKIDSSTRTIQVHRLIQTLLREELSSVEQEKVRHEVHLLLAGSAPKDAEDPGDWKAFEELVPHLAYSNLAECSSPNVRKFALDTVRYLYRVGNYELARSQVEELIEKWTAQEGSEDHGDVLVARKHLGNILRGMGEYTAAYETDHTTLEAMRRTLGPTHSETLWATNSYGSTLRARGEFLRARELDDEVLRSYQSGARADKAAVFRVRHNLAIDHSLTSEYTRAMEMFQTLLGELNAPGSGANPAQLLATWNGLSRAVRLCGDYELAIDVGQDAFDYGKKFLTLDNHWTMLTAKDLSIAMRRRGYTAEALRLAETTYEGLKRLLGVQHSDSLAAAANLSNALRMTGELEKAHHLAAAITPIYPNVFGPQHPFSHAIEGNLAVLERLRGDPDKARAINEKVVKALIDDLGWEHDFTLTASVNLQSDLAELGEHVVAARNGRDLSQRLRKLFGANHFMTLSCEANLSIDLRALGRTAEADTLKKDVLDRYQGLDSTNHLEAELTSQERRIDCDFDPQPI